MVNRGTKLILLATVILCSVSTATGAKSRTSYSFQQTLLNQGVQERGGDDWFDPLNLLPEETVLDDLPSAKDPETGKKIFHLTIEEAISRALSNSPEIRVVSFEPKISDEEITRADAEFDPIIFGRANLNKTKTPNNKIPGFFETPISTSRTENRKWEAGIKQKTTTGSEWSLTWAMVRNWDNVVDRRLSTRYEPVLTFQIAQPLLRGAWKEFNLGGVNISKLNYRIALTAFRQKTEDLAVEVIITYWALLQNRRNLEIQQQLFDETMNTLRKVQDRSDIDATAVQIKQAEASAKTRQAVLIGAKQSVIDAQDALARLIADPNLNIMTDAEIIPVSNLVMMATEFNPFDTIALALRHNPQLEQARLGLEISEINIELAKNQTLPKLDLVTSASMQGFDDSPGDASEGTFNDNFSSYGVGLSFEYPLGNRQSEAELRIRKLQRLRALSNIQNISDQVAKQVKERIRTLQRTHEQIAIQTEAADAAGLNLQALKDTEKVRGTLSPEFLLVKLQAQALLAEAERSKIKATVDFNTALATLAQTTGTVLQLRQVADALPPETR